MNRKDPNDRSLSLSERSAAFEETIYFENSEIKGPESLPFHLFEKRIGKENASIIKKRTEKNLRRDVEMEPYSFINQDEMHANIANLLDEAVNLNPSLQSLTARGDKRTLRMGGIQPTRLKRESLKLTRALSNDVYKEAIEVICEEMRNGLRDSYPTEKDLKKANVYVTLPKNRNRGDGMMASTGTAGNNLLHNEVLPTMRDNDSAFYYMGKEYTNLHGLRIQQNSGYVNDHDQFCGKWREANVHTPSGVATALSHVFEPDDGFTGMRSRLVTGVPTKTNIPLIIVNAIYMNNLNANLKSIWKATQDEIVDWAVGTNVICTDFAQFEATQEKETRAYVSELLYSEQLRELQDEIDSYNLAYGYVDWLKDPKTGDYGEKTVYGYINRWSDKYLRDEFSPLTSGTGDTALNGKVLGLAAALTYLSFVTNKTPRNLLIDSKDSTGISLAGKEIRNCGDDNATRFADSVSESSYSDGQSMADAYVKALDSIVIYDISIEYPAGYQGLILHQDKVGGIVLRAHLNEAKIILNNTHMENAWNNPVRSDEMIGLYGSYAAYYTSLSNAGWDDADISVYSNLLFKILGGHLTIEKVFEEASIRAEALMIEGNTSQMVIMKAVELLNLNSANDLAWKVTTEQIAEVLTEEEMGEIYIPLPENITSDFTRYVRT
jgi:hypothetical protein